ncbi:MAG: acetylxylan esterase [Thermoguttaceae bacterium]|jgi:hypothetical protein
MKSRYVGLSVLMAMLAAATLAAAGELELPKDKISGGEPEKMMQQYWLRQVDSAAQRWREEYEKRTAPEQISAYQARLREEFLKAIGGLPERTPLAAQVTGTVARDGYRVEKIIFESQPKHYVTGLLFLPDAERFKAPYPGVLIPCGHAMSAKGHDEYQTMGALLALSGMAAFVFDPIDQGERGQRLGDDGWPKLWGTTAHWMVGVGSMLVGRNTARFEIWDGIRAIDYLQSRPEIDPQRIGCTGNSGGGTQTAYLMALENRLKAAAPSCYLCGFPALLHTIGPQDAEQTIFGQLAFGMDHADYLMMQAPTPFLVCAATQDFFDIQGTWTIFRYAKRLYTRMGCAERLDILENDAKHNYNTVQREGVVRWMARWLLGKDQPIKEPRIALLDENEIRCTPDGMVMNLAGARSVYDLNEDYENELAVRRAAAWKDGRRAELLDRVRSLAGIRKLGELPEPQVESLGAFDRNGYRIERLVLRPEEGIWLPALKFLPARPNGKVVLYLHEAGKAAGAADGGPIEKRVLAGEVVLAVDVRGTGQTQPGGPGKPGVPPPVDTKGVFLAYLLGRSYVGVRAEDVLVCARYARNLEQNKSPGVSLVAVGNLGVPALHAAALEPGLFDAVSLSRSLRSWSSVVHNHVSQDQVVNAVHGALVHYDLPDLAKVVGEKLSISEPLGPMGQPIE